MEPQLQIAAMQGNPATADPAGNAERILQARASQPAADLLVTPAFALSGAPLFDLAASGAFAAALDRELARLAAATADGGPAILLGTLRQGASALLLLAGGRTTGIWPGPGLFDLGGVRLAAANAAAAADGGDPRVRGRLRAADLVLLADARPFAVADAAGVEAGLQALAAGIRRPLLYVNRAGAADDLLFAGESLALDADGALRARLPAFAETVAPLRFDLAGGFEAARVSPREGDEERIYQALCVALRDYVARNRFPGVLLGLSGGIDSALVAAVAVDALGAGNVWCVLLPSRFTSATSDEDAAQCAEALGVRFDRISIRPAVDAMESMLAPQFAGRPRDLAEENLQSRMRMVALMGLSNKFGPLLLSTGNKSEVAVGYGTLYGDMAGGYNPLKDVYKTMVFRLARWRNRNRPGFCLGPPGRVIPERILTKPPTAELRDNQRDEDSLPPYDVLDPLLQALVEERLPAGEIVARGLADAATVRRVEQLLFAAEHKRRQSCPGPKLGRASFGGEWRYPLTNPFRSADQPPAG